MKVAVQTSYRGQLYISPALLKTASQRFNPTCSGILFLGYYRMSVIFFLHFISVRHFFSPQKKTPTPPGEIKISKKRVRRRLFRATTSYKMFLLP